MITPAFFAGLRRNDRDVGTHGAVPCQMAFLMVWEACGRLAELMVAR